MNDLSWLPDCPPLEYRGWIVLGLFILGFLISSIIAGFWGGGDRVFVNTVLVIVAHVLFAPYVTYDTISRFQHPEQLDAIDLPMILKDPHNWPYFVIPVECLCLYYFWILRKFNRTKKASLLYERALMLAAQGNFEEGDVFFAEAERIMGHKRR